MTNDAAASTVRAHQRVPESACAFLEQYLAVPRAGFFDRLVGRNAVPRGLRDAYRTATGDVAVMDALSQLGTDWWTHEPKSGDDNQVEHLFIGPSGAFSMVIRHHPGGAIWIDGGVILVDGERLPDLREAEFGGVRLTQIVSDAMGSRIEVTPCLMLVGHRSLTVAKPPRRVAVTTVRDIRPWLKGMPRVLTDPDVEALRTAVTGHPELHMVGNTVVPSTASLEAFRKVQSEVAQARHIRLTWVTASLVLAWLIAVVGIGGVTTGLLIR